jgi:hypothetical protein
MPPEDGVAAPSSRAVSVVERRSPSGRRRFPTMVHEIDSAPDRRDRRARAAAKQGGVTPA